jgi:hypothetical protein
MCDCTRRSPCTVALCVGGALFVALMLGWAVPAAEGSGPDAAAAVKYAPPVQPLLAWTVARDTGDVFVVDAAAVLYRLSPSDLSVVGKSTVLFKALPKAPVFLTVDESRLFVSNLVVTRTQVLRRSDFHQMTVLNEAGPMAVDPGRRLFMVSRGALVYYDLQALTRAPTVLIPALKLGAYGDVPRDVIADAAGRRLYVRTYGALGSPPHNPEFYALYDLDTLARVKTFNPQLANLSRISLAEAAVEIVLMDRAYAGFLGSALRVFDPGGTELRSAHPIDGTPAIDATGTWIYLLRERGLWVLNAGDLSCKSIFPFQTEAPADLALSLDGQHLYLFGNGWLAVKDTPDLQTLGTMPVSPLPVAWNRDTGTFFGPAFFPSPQMKQDGTAFVQVGGYGETYRTTDGGRSWRFLPALTYPDFMYALHLSLSPDFARDRTLVALARQLDTLLRSTDGGDTWDFWTPRIAFVSDRGGNRDVYTMQQDGVDVRRVTDAPSAEENPAWSPAWTRLAFQSNRNGNWDIFTVRADCQPGPDCDLKQLTDNPADDMLPAWSPDGRAIAFVSTRDGNPEIYLMDSDGQNQRRLTFNPTGDWRPAWLPDSRQFVFTSDRTGHNGLYLMAAPAGAEKLTAEPKVTPFVVGASDNRDPAVSAAGIVAFLSDRGGMSQAYRQDLGPEGSTASLVAKGIEPEGHPSWVDDAGVHGGGLLVSIERNGATNIFKADYPDRYIAMTNGSSFDGHPAWGPAWWRPDSQLSRAQLKPYQK